jgi:hypothetical protein
MFGMLQEGLLMVDKEGKIIMILTVWHEATPKKGWKW